MTPTPRVQCYPVLGTTYFDRVASSLFAILFCLLILSCTLSFVWFSNLESGPPATRVFPDIQLLGGSPSVTAQSLDVSPPEETTDDPSVRASPSVSAEVLALVEQLGELEPSDVQEPGVAAGTGADDREGSESSTVPPIESNPERWFFKVDCEQSVEAYAEMLDQLGIELGAFDAAGFCYLSELSRSTPTVRRVTKGKDERFYTVWQQGTLAGLDREIFRRANIVASRGQVLHFFSSELEARLAQLELKAARAKGQKSRDIRRTYFRIGRQPSGSYGIAVERQYFR